jgi:hypothetical protein
VGIKIDYCWAYYDIQYLNMSVQFNQSTLQAWVSLCDEEGRLKREGAVAEVLEAMRIRVATALVALIQEAQAAALLEQLLGAPPQSIVTETTEEAGDPSAE